MKKVIIGIADCSKYTNYEKWLLNEPNVDVIKLGYTLDNFKALAKCDGLLLTGGEDVHPRFYNKPEYLELCERDNMDEKRDEFELKLLEYTENQQLPVLGICRGLQIANVAFGGTLIPDIPSTGKPDHAKVNGVDRYHLVKIGADSTLRQVSGIAEESVNSAHHQSADSIGNGLRVNAISPEGIVEGLERENPGRRSFLMLVQWHPERMTEQESPLVRNIKLNFINNIRN